MAIRRVEMAVLVGVLLVAVVGAGLVLGHGNALSWDESVYAVAARGMVTDSPVSGVMVYRPPGLPVLGTIAIITGFSDAALRAVAVGLGLAALLASWLLGRVVFGARVAMLGVIATLSARVVLDQLPLFHNDLASAGTLLLIMALLWHEFEVRPEPGRALLLVAPLAAAAFYLRYGIMAGLLAIALGAAILWPKVLWHRRGLVAAVAILTLVLVSPHIAEAMTATGRPWGILTMAAAQVNTSNPGEAAATYLRWLPSELAGRFAVVFVIAGVLLTIAVAIRSMVRRSAGPLGRRVAWLAIPAAAAAMSTISVSHAEARYVVFSTILVVLLGAKAIDLLFDWLLATVPVAQGARRALPTVAAVLVIAVAALTIGLTVRAETRGAPTGRWLRQPSEAIAAATERPCVVVTTMYPIVAWYSGCATVKPASTTPETLFSASAAEYWIMITSVDAERAADGMDAFRSLVTEPPFASTDQGRKYGRAYRAEP